VWALMLFSVGIVGIVGNSPPSSHSADGPLCGFCIGKLMERRAVKVW
jgi:hypothetical protein